MPAKRPTKEELLEGKKCSFCKKRNAVGKINIIYYCSNDACAIMLWNKKERQYAIDFERGQKKKKKHIDW